jgi:hypothetical protein
MCPTDSDASRRTDRRLTVIAIVDDYRLAADAQSWQIQKRRQRRGQDEWESIGWYNTVDHAVRALGERLVRTSGAQTLAEFQAAVDRIATTLSQALTPRVKSRRKS